MCGICCGYKLTIIANARVRRILQNAELASMSEDNHSRPVAYPSWSKAPS